MATMRWVTSHPEGQAERRGVTEGCPDAQRGLTALKRVDRRPPAPPEGAKTVMD